MINAIIADNTLGFSENGLYVGFSFLIKGEEQTTKTITTQPIYLVGQNEDFRQNSAAYSIMLLLDVVGVATWESMKDKGVQIELTEDGIITKIANILDDSRFVILGQANSKAPGDATEVADEA